MWIGFLVLGLGLVIVVQILGKSMIIAGLD